MPIDEHRRQQGCRDGRPKINNNVLDSILFRRNYFFSQNQTGSQYVQRCRPNVSKVRRIDKLKSSHTLKGYLATFDYCNSPSLGEHTVTLNGRRTNRGITNDVGQATVSIPSPEIRTNGRVIPSSKCSVALILSEALHQCAQ